MLYTITIYLVTPSIVSKNYDMPYYMSGTQKDKVSFSSNKIIIRAKRKKLCSEDTIFFNVQNSIYNQMYKCLLFHYAVNGENSKIEKIGIEVTSQTFCKKRYVKEFSDENQPFPLYKSPVAFDIQSLELLFDETNNAYQARMVMAHWMTAVVKSNNTLKKLECLWRTFERLCAYHRHRPINERSNIADGLKMMIEELTNNPLAYSKSENFVHSYTEDYLRGFLWHDMIANNYPKGGNEFKYKDYVKYLVSCFHDERVVKLMYDMRHYREQDLKHWNLYSSMKHELLNKMAAPVQNDVDLVALLCCHYAYYLRNRLFHGQSLIRCSIFKTNVDSMRLESISNLLELIIIELINNLRNL